MPSGAYDIGRQVKGEGKVTQILWRLDAPVNTIGDDITLFLITKGKSVKTWKQGVNQNEKENKKLYFD